MREKKITLTKSGRESAEREADLREYVDSYDRDQGRATTLITKCWQSVQSRGTKNMNFEKTWKTYTPQPGKWAGAKKSKRQSCGIRWKVTNNKPRSHESQPQMEGIVYLVAEWISLTEMRALQSACMLVSTKAREKEYEEFLSYQDGQIWKEMPEEWQSTPRWLPALGADRDAQSLDWPTGAQHSRSQSSPAAADAAGPMHCDAQPQDTHSSAQDASTQTSWTMPRRHVRFKRCTPSSIGQYQPVGNPSKRICWPSLAHPACQCRPVGHAPSTVHHALSRTP